MDNVLLRGLKGISKCFFVRIHHIWRIVMGRQQQSYLGIGTVGSNLLVALGLDYIDETATYTNSITEMYRVLGIAARQSIYNEFLEITEKDGSYINAHHLGLLTDRMTYSHKMISIFRHGINNTTYCEGVI